MRLGGGRGGWETCACTRPGPVLVVRSRRQILEFQASLTSRPGKAEVIQEPFLILALPSLHPWQSKIFVPEGFWLALQ